MSFLTRQEREALETIQDAEERTILWEAAMRANYEDQFPAGGEFSLNSRRMCKRAETDTSHRLVVTRSTRDAR